MWKPYSARSAAILSISTWRGGRHYMGIMCILRDKNTFLIPLIMLWFPRFTHFQPRTRQPWRAQPHHWWPPDRLISTWHAVYQAVWKKEIKPMILSKMVLHSPGCNLLPLSPAALQPDTKICFCLLVIHSEWRNQAQRLALELEIT